MFKHHKIETQGSWGGHSALLLIGSLRDLLKTITRPSYSVLSRAVPSRSLKTYPSPPSSKPPLLTSLSIFSHVNSDENCKTRDEVLGDLSTTQPLHQINFGLGHFERFQPSEARVRFDMRKSSLFEVFDGPPDSGSIRFYMCIRLMRVLV